MGIGAHGRGSLLLWVKEVEDVGVMHRHHGSVLVLLTLMQLPGWMTEASSVCPRWLKSSRHSDGGEAVAVVNVAKHINLARYVH